MMNSRPFAVAAFAAAVLLPAAAFAQAAPPPPPPPGAAVPAPPAGRHHHAGWRAAMRGITLSDAQKQQLEALTAQRRREHQAQQGQPVDPATRRADAEAFRQKVEAILTPSQRTQFEQNLAALRARPPQNAPGGTP